MIQHLLAPIYIFNLRPFLPPSLGRALGAVTLRLAREIMVRRGGVWSATSRHLSGVSSTGDGGGTGRGRWVNVQTQALSRTYIASSNASAPVSDLSCRSRQHGARDSTPAGPISHATWGALARWLSYFLLTSTSQALEQRFASCCQPAPPILSSAQRLASYRQRVVLVQQDLAEMLPAVRSEQRTERVQG